MPRRRRVNGVPETVAVVAHDVGRLLAMEATLMGLTVVVAVVFGELHQALAFALAGVLTGGVGIGVAKAFADVPVPGMKHGMVIAAAGWFAVAVFGALPLLFGAHLTPAAVAAGFVPAGADYGRSSLLFFRDPVHALFESMSGWTGSGLTMAVHEPSLPRTVQWWRSLMQWVGGVGVIVLTVSILSRPGSGSYALYQSEARERKIHPSVVSTVRTVWKLFLGYSLLSVVLLFFAISATPYGSSLPTWEVFWQALNHAMTGLATGGFSVTDNSIATYDSVLIEFVLLPVMTLGAIAFPVHYAVLGDRDRSALTEDLQTRWLLALLGAGIVVLSLQNVLVAGDGAAAFDAAGAALPILPSLLDAATADAIRDSTFQWVSALTCTGFQSAPIGRWSAGGKVIVSVAMVLGGAAGSTVGGIKIIRGYTIVRGIAWQFARVFLPAKAVVAVEIDGRTLGRHEMNREFAEAAIVTILWIVLLVAGSVVLVNLTGPSVGYADALFEVASAQGNVGLSAGITGPSMHPVAELMFVLNMWIGRLEIIPVLVFARSVLYGMEP